MVAALAGEPPDHGANRVGPETLALEARVEADVHARVPVTGVRLLLEAEPAGEPAIDLDGEGAAALRVLPEAGAHALRIVRLPPPLAHAWALDDGDEPVEVRGSDGPERHALALQHGERHGVRLRRSDARRAAARGRAVTQVTLM